MAKAKAFDMTRIVFGSLLLVFAFLQAPLEIILLFASAYIFVMGYGVYARIQIEKEL